MRPPTTLACPSCGGPTRVSETRANPAGLRRARRCDDDDCDGRLTTQEVTVRVYGARAAAVPQRFNGRVALVPQELVNRLVSLVAEIGERPGSQSHPEDEVTL